MYRFQGVALSLFVLAFSTDGRACGLSPPIGPSGLPAVCHGEQTAPRVRAGLTIGGTSTKIDFDEQTATLLQAATTATLDLLVWERLTLGAALGASLGGKLDYAGEEFDLLPGPIGGVGASYRLFGGRAPFVLPSVTFSLARSTSRAPSGAEASFTSRDLRFGIAIGKTFGTVAAPFVVARYFGAGTSWPDVAGDGSDHYRYHVGAGSAFKLSEHFDVLGELAFLGERRATLGVGYLF